MSTLVEESDIVGEDGRRSGGAGQDVPRGLPKQDVLLARYPLSRTSSRYYIVTTEQVRMVNLLAMSDLHLSWPVFQVIMASPRRGNLYVYLRFELIDRHVAALLATQVVPDRVHQEYP